MTNTFMDILENRDSWLAEFEDGWLKHYWDTGEIAWKLYNLPRNQHAPAGKGVDLRKSRLMLISSAGGYLKDRQEPFDATDDLGDYTIRTFPSTTQPEQISFAHEHYDHTAVNADQQVLFPLAHLHERVAAGAIGELASVVNFMGYQPVATRVVDETIPAILDVTKQEQVDAALLVPA
ncbi:glycine/betaine/sarcosine/D-proline family reductase selenoprotein B [Chloroflexi bacterium TSY]|nr:glycine/betaine/sarcosine/D-proline family reductase selenoprotein B [Chloroflexi bacterium TSY]